MRKETEHDFDHIFESEEQMNLRLNFIYTEMEFKRYQEIYDLTDGGMSTVYEGCHWYYDDIRNIDVYVDLD